MAFFFIIHSRLYFLGAGGGGGGGVGWGVGGCGGREDIILTAPHARAFCETGL